MSKLKKILPGNKLSTQKLSQTAPSTKKAISPALNLAYVEAIKVLKLARLTITPIGKWNKHTPALGADGCEVSPTSPLAESFCALGALSFAKNKLGVKNERARRALQYVAYFKTAQLHNTPTSLAVVNFNDNLLTTQADVLELFDQAIQRILDNAHKA